MHVTWNSPEVILQIYLHNPSTQAMEVHLESGCHHDSFASKPQDYVSFLMGPHKTYAIYWVVLAHGIVRRYINNVSYPYSKLIVPKDQLSVGISTSSMYTQSGLCPFINLYIFLSLYLETSIPSTVAFW